MAVEIEKAATIGFCFGVKRAIDRIEDLAGKRNGVETLGELVHNKQVLSKLAGLGVRVVGGIDDIKGGSVVIGTHGISPQVIDSLKSRGIETIDTTCSFVKRAQNAARKLAESGFYTVVYGDADHAEVKGILGWVGGMGMATLDAGAIPVASLPRRLGILSQTTQKPASFNSFVRQLVDIAMVKDSEIRVIDTICHDIRQRQEDALELARRVDMVLVVGGHNSANTRHLVELCSTASDTYHIESPDEIDTRWLKGKAKIGIAAGASTDELVIDEVYKRLKTIIEG